jgi:hypothetical protein
MSMVEAREGQCYLGVYHERYQHSLKCNYKRCGS